MELKQDKKYQTKAGNIVRCLAIVAEAKEAVCAYTEIKCEGHESLMNKAQRWKLDGKWSQYPGGIHDIVKEV